MVRPYDAVGRYGGEEFLIVAPGCRLAEAVELAERVRSHVAGCSIMVGGSKVSVSLTWESPPEKPQPMRKILHAADAAMYQAKNAPAATAWSPAQNAPPAQPRRIPGPESDFWM